MEHIIVETLSNGYYRLTPETGYALYDVRTQSTYSHAEVKDPKPFKAIKL